MNLHAALRLTLASVLACLAHGLCGVAHADEPVTDAGTPSEEEPRPVEEEDDGFTLPFSIASTSLFEYRGNNHDPNDFNDDFFALRQNLTLLGTFGDFAASLRLDGFLPVANDSCPVGFESLCIMEADARPERASLLWVHDVTTLGLGDSYATLGRGYALKLRHDSTVGLDVALRGMQWAVDTGSYFSRVLVGLANPQNLDPITLAVYDDPRDLIAGTEIGVRVGESNDLELGFHASRVVFERDSDSGTSVHADVIGWHGAIPSLLEGELSLYVETNALIRVRNSERDGQRRTLGRAVYGSVQWQHENWSVLTEWKDYRNFFLALGNGEVNAWRVYSALPSLDRPQERVRAAYNTRGGRLEVSHAFLPGPWSVSFNGLAFGHEDDAELDPWNGILALHGTTTVGRENNADPEDLGWAMHATTGYRRELYLRDQPDLDIAKGDLEWEVIHAEADLTLAKNDHSFELKTEQRFERRFFPATGFDKYVRGGVFLTWSYKGVLSISPALRWDSLKENQSPIYPGGEVKWDFAEGCSARVFGGRTPGGFVCSGGSCRDVPAFEGAQVEAVLRF